MHLDYYSSLFCHTLTLICLFNILYIYSIQYIDSVDKLVQAKSNNFIINVKMMKAVTSWLAVTISHMYFVTLKHKTQTHLNVSLRNRNSFFWCDKFEYSNHWCFLFSYLHAWEKKLIKTKNKTVNGN